jgi:hypothetical protein
LCLLAQLAESSSRPQVLVADVSGLEARVAELEHETAKARKVRKTPSWPRSWANFSLF